ncbi:MAG: HAMP domain-containing sensor histidine kinase [Candidatus Saccharimonadales bacterium]
MRHNRSLFDSATLRLTTWYVVILMSISLLFSVLLYNVASAEFDRAFGPRGGGMQMFINDDSVVNLRQQMVRDSNQRLTTSLFLFNLFVLTAGGGVAYVLAKRTMEPIEQALEAQSRFSSDAAHELKTPLTVMQSELEIELRDKTATKLSQRTVLESALDEVHRMRTLTERLLLLARQDTVEVSQVNTNDVSVDALNRIIPLATSKQIRVDNTIGAHEVMADRESLIDVLSIILENAIKYSSKNSTITLDSSKHQRMVDIRVTDKGIGISQEDQTKIFDRFYRADTSRSKQNVEGYGLGLSIANRLMDLQAGSISVESSEGKGSTFTITLPSP